MTTEILQELQEIKQLLAFNKKVWSLDDFCAYTGLSKSYAYRLTGDGKVSFFKPFGKVIFFDADEVIEFLKQNPSMGAKGLKERTDKHLLNH